MRVVRRHINTLQGTAGAKQHRKLRVLDLLFQKAPLCHLSMHPENTQHLHCTRGPTSTRPTPTALCPPPVLLTHSSRLGDVLHIPHTHQLGQLLHQVCLYQGSGEAGDQLYRQAEERDSKQLLSG